MQPAIRVENLAKCYRINHAVDRGSYKTLRESLTGAVTAPFNRWKSGPNGSPRNEDFWALKDVSFDVQPGEVVGIIGRNGAGKSTLLKILSRITKPTNGQVTLHGRVGSLLEVGTGFHPELTGRENIYLNGSILGMAKAEISKQFDAIVDFSGVEKFLDTPVKRYSSGMYVRLAFAVAAHLNPEILIIDEVLAVGDAEFQNKCLGKIRDVSRSGGRTVLLVSHNMGIVRSVCIRAILIASGKVAAEGSADFVIDEYMAAATRNSGKTLRERKDRRGNGRVRIESIHAGTSLNAVSDHLLTGEPAHFIFKVNDMIPALSCRFSIIDQHGTVVVHFNSAVHSSADTTDPLESRQFSCELDEFLLCPGEYRINAALMVSEDLIDHIEAATVIQVEAGSVRGRPVSRQAGFGTACLAHRWLLPQRSGRGTLE